MFKRWRGSGALWRVGSSGFGGLCEAAACGILAGEERGFDEECEAWEDCEDAKEFCGFFDWFRDIAADDEASTDEVVCGIAEEDERGACCEAEHDVVACAEKNEEAWACDDEREDGGENGRDANSAPEDAGHDGGLGREPPVAAVSDAPAAEGFRVEVDVSVEFSKSACDCEECEPACECEVSACSMSDGHDDGEERCENPGGDLNGLDEAAFIEHVRKV